MASSLMSDYERTASGDGLRVKQATEKKDWSHLNFTPELVSVKDLKKGAVFVMPAFGPLKYLENKIIDGQGYSVNTAVFETIHGAYAGRQMLVVLASFQTKNLRKPVPKNILSKLPNALEDGFKIARASAVRPIHQAKHYQDLLKTTDIIFMAGGLRDAATKNDSSVAKAFMAKAIELIAAEYAVVTGMDFQKACTLISEKCGRKSINEINAVYDVRAKKKAADYAARKTPRRTPPSPE